VTDVERVRVGRFEWERLMLVSDLPWTTRSVLLALAVYMSADGGNARPGLRNMVTVTGLAQRSLSRHLTSAVEKGYLGLRYRGGYRGGRSGDVTLTRASVYDATVPKDVFDRGVETLRSPPWRRSNEPATGGTFVPESLIRSVSDPPNEHANGGNEPANRGNEPATGGTPSRSAHHVMRNHVVASNRTATPFGRHGSKTTKSDHQVITEAATIVIDDGVCGADWPDAVDFARWIRRNRPDAKHLAAYVRALAADRALEPLWQQYLSTIDDDQET